MYFICIYCVYLYIFIQNYYWLYWVTNMLIRIQDTFISHLFLLFQVVFNSTWVVSDKCRWFLVGCRWLKISHFLFQVVLVGFTWFAVLGVTISRKLYQTICSNSPVLREQLLTSRFFQKSLVFRWSWLKC